MEGELLENGAASLATESLWTNPLPVVFKKDVKEKLRPRQSWNWLFEVIWELSMLTEVTDSQDFCFHPVRKET